jgi:hypothetical protein
MFIFIQTFSINIQDILAHDQIFGIPRVVTKTICFDLFKTVKTKKKTSNDLTL